MCFHLLSEIKALHPVSLEGSSVFQISLVVSIRSSPQSALSSVIIQHVLSACHMPDTSLGAATVQTGTTAKWGMQWTAGG